MITDFELGWLIGILEGEASFGYYGHSQRVAVEMSDEDTITKLAVLFGRIIGSPVTIREFDRPHRVNSDNHSTMYRIQVTGNRARTIMRFVVSHMGTRRRARIWQSLNEYVIEKKTFADLGINVIALIKERSI